MTGPFQTQADGITYTVVGDCATSYGALITGGAVDEILGDFLNAQFTVQTSRDDLLAKTYPNGLFAVSGYPDKSFPETTPTNYQVNLVLSAPGYRDFPVQVMVTPATVFPIAVANSAMRRLPVRIQGRVVSDTTRLPISGALVLSVDNPTPPPHSYAIALRSPLYFDHALPVSVQQVTIGLVGTAQLTSDASAGATALNVTTRSGLAPNSTVRLANASQTLVEYCVVDHLGPGAANQAGQIFITNALNRSYSAGAATPVLYGNPALAGAAIPISKDANRGDGILVASQLLQVSTVAVGPSSMQVEYHEVGALTDADGYFGLNGMGRVPDLYLQASQGAANRTQWWFVAYDEPINVVDFRL